MIQKSASTKGSGFLRKSITTVLVFEVAAVIGSYFIWSRMNRDQEFRYLMHNKCPYILESFYTFGELWDSEKIKRVRCIDLMKFEEKNNSK